MAEVEESTSEIANLRHQVKRSIFTAIAFFTLMVFAVAVLPGIVGRTLANVLATIGAVGLVGSACNWLYAKAQVLIQENST